MAKFEFDCILLKPGLLQPGFHVAGYNGATTSLTGLYVLPRADAASRVKAETLARSPQGSLCNHTQTQSQIILHIH